MANTDVTARIIAQQTTRHRYCDCAIFGKIPSAFMLNFSHSDLNLFSPRAYVVFKTKGNALHLHLSVTILLSRSCLYFSHFGRDRLLQLACLSRVGVLVHRSLCAAKIQRDTYSGLISQLQLSP